MSSAEQLTLVNPREKVLPDGGLQVTVGEESQLSIAVTLNDTTALQEVLSVTAAMSGIAVNAGASLSVGEIL